MKIRSLFKLALSTFAFFALVNGAWAIGVSPAKTELDINPGETKTVSIAVYNNTDKDMDNVVVEVEALKGNDESGTPIWGSTIDKELLKKDKYNVSEWITYSKEGFKIDAGKSKEVEIEIAVPQDAEPGGKYVGIMFSQQKKDNFDGTGIVIVGRAASLLLLTVYGDIIQDAEIEGFELPVELRSDEDIPFSVVFKNTGNVHLKPLGEIKILNKKTGKDLKDIGLYKPSGSQDFIISEGIFVNYDGGHVLPGSARNYLSSWTQNFENGEFTAIASVGYDNEEERVADKQLSFELKESVKIDEFNINLLPSSANFTLTVTNTGNIIERLTGYISITNFFKYEVSKIDIPEDIEYVNPGETKTYTFDWINTEIPRGKYTATLNAKLGLTKADVNADIGFGYMTYTMYAIIGIISVLFLLLLLFFVRKNNKI